MNPQGYYDASAGAEDLLGWHVNQGPDKEALFYPIAQFREQFHRPDVVSLVLDTQDVQVALQQANKAQQAAAQLAPGGLVSATGQPRAQQRVLDLRTALPPRWSLSGSPTRPRCPPRIWPWNIS